MWRKYAWLLIGRFSTEIGGEIPGSREGLAVWRWGVSVGVMEGLAVWRVGLAVWRVGVGVGVMEGLGVWGVSVGGNGGAWGAGDL